MEGIITTGAKLLKILVVKSKKNKYFYLKQFKTLIFIFVKFKNSKIIYNMILFMLYNNDFNFNEYIDNSKIKKTIVTLITKWKMNVFLQMNMYKALIYKWKICK